jgi:hypothetical protein
MDEEEDFVHTASSLSAFDGGPLITLYYHESSKAEISLEMTHELWLPIAWPSCAE